MRYDRPFYHRSDDSLLGAYPVRILLGLTGSLAFLLLLLHLPMTKSPDRVGWTSSRGSEWIPLSQVQEQDIPPEQETSSNQASGTMDHAPPPTRHSSPNPSSTTASDAESGRNTEEDTREQSDESSPVRSIAELSVEDERPEIVGGMGSLYLRINYPPEAREKGIEGRLTLQFTITREGDVQHIDVTDSLHPLCDSAAVRALQSVKFKPATRDGDPIPIRMSLPIRFELRSTPALRSQRSLPSGG